MLGPSLEDDHRLLRHVPPKKRIVDPLTKRVTLTPDAFKPQPGEDALSASWVEFYGAEATEQSMHDLGSQIEIRKSHFFARGRIGDIADAFERGGAEADFEHDGLDYPSHVSVGGIAAAAELAYERLADSAWAEVLTPTEAVIAKSRALSDQRNSASRRSEL